MFSNSRKFSKYLVAAAIVLSGMYGAAKFMVRNDTTIGADASYTTFWGIDTILNTNNIPTNVTVRVCWTNDINLITLETPLAYRTADSNDWTVVTYPADTTIYTSGITNILEFTIENTDEIDFSKVNRWWVGEDRPGVVIVITGDDVKITEFKHDSEHVEIAWTVADDLLNTVKTTASSYSYAIEYVPANSMNWQEVLSDIITDSNTNSVVIPGFFYGNDRDWRVKLTYELGGSHE